MKAWFCITEEGKRNLRKLYKELTGMSFAAPRKDKQTIHAETKIEDLEEIEKTMREKPDYTISEQGRK